MDVRENALRILRFDSPERVVEGLPTVDCSYFGVNHEPFGGVGGHESPVGSFWHDIWGVGWRRQLDGVMGFAVEHPLADLTRLDRFPFPDPDDERLCRQVYERANAADRAAGFLRGSHRETLWERCYNLVGMDNLMLAFHDAPEAVRELLHRVMDFQLGIARHYAAVGIEVAGLGDDLGSQRGLLFSPDILRDFFVPEYRRLCAFYKERGVIIHFHSCGRIVEVLDVFMDLGVDVLNPVQATANGLQPLAYLAGPRTVPHPRPKGRFDTLPAGAGPAGLDLVRRLTQGRMALQGGVSTHTIMTGPVSAIRDETRRRLWQLGRDGGYFCAPDQGMPFPEEHINAFRETVERYGVYPLSPPDTEAVGRQRDEPHG